MERAFRSDVRNFLACLLGKLFDRCPLQYPLTRAISSLSPIEIKRLTEGTLKKRFNTLVTILNESGWISNSSAEKAEKQYLVLIQNKDFIKAAGKFDIIKDRVDDFWMKILDSASTLDLENIVRIVMILSHGNCSC